MHERTAAGYDAVAREYAARLSRELDAKPFDRRFLADFERDVPEGTVLDLGCGPGHVGRFLHDLGRRVIGIDLSAAMIDEARRLCDGMTFQRGDLCALDVADASVAGVVAFYSIIHLPPEEIAVACREMHRVLMPGGRLALAFHVGDEIRHVDALWGVPTDLDFHLLRPADVEATLVDAGFDILRSTTRPPYAPEVEAQTHRRYVIAARRRERRA